LSMLSEFQQDELWRLWISAEIRADYFADMSTRYARLHSWLIWSTLFFSAGTVAAIIGNLPDDYGWLKPALALITTALSLLSIVMQNPKKSAECAELHFKSNRLAAEYQALWSNVYSDDAEAKFANLIEKEADVSKASLAFPNKPKIVEKWERHVLEQRTGAPASA
jgi:hypothetical protein